MTRTHNKSMDVRAKQRLYYQTGLFNSELCGFGFAPRHLNRSASARFSKHFGNEAEVL